MQSPGYGIATAPKFPSRVQGGQYNLQSRDTHSGMLIYRYSPTIIAFADTIIRMNNHIYLVTVTGYGLIYAVVYNFKNQVMQTFGTC